MDEESPIFLTPPRGSKEETLPPTTKATKAKRPARRSSSKAAANQAKGKRYSAEEKAEIVAFVEQVNAEKGRGGITAASRQFGVTPLTIGAWIKTAGPPTRGGGRSKATAGDFQRLAELHEEIVEAEEKLAELNREYVVLKRKL